MSDDQRRSRAAQALPHRITVLGAFTLTVEGAPVALSVDARRLVAYLAVHPRPQARPAEPGPRPGGVVQAQACGGGSLPVGSHRPGQVAQKRQGALSRWTTDPSARVQGRSWARASGPPRVGASLRRRPCVWHLRAR